MEPLVAGLIGFGVAIVFVGFVLFSFEGGAGGLRAAFLEMQVERKKRTARNHERIAKARKELEGRS